MNIRTRSRPKNDAMDLDHLEQVINSSGWQMIRKRLEQMYTEAEKDLDHAMDLHQLGLAQGFRAALRKVNDVPKTLREEVLKREAKRR